MSSIAILASAALTAWDPESVQTGIGGSEEAIIYATECLVKKGYTVTIFAQPPTNSPWMEETKNPRYRLIQSFLEPNLTFDIVICWRRSDYLLARSKGQRVYAWHHDLPSTPIRDDQYLHERYLTGSFYLSHFQQDAFERLYPHRSSLPKIISGNGICNSLPPLTDVQLGAKDATNCVYISNWARGLELLLQIWPRVRAKVPTATLDIYYGPQTWGLWTAEKTQSVVAQISNMATIGVSNHGMVGHHRLDAALAKSSVWTYPCNCFGETYCISGMKAQFWGNIPVTTRLGALKETIAPDGLGVDNPFTSEHLEEYTSTLISLLKRLSTQNNTQEVIEWRQKFISWAKPRTWEACVNAWIQLWNA